MMKKSFFVLIMISAILGLVGCDDKLQPKPVTPTAPAPTHTPRKTTFSGNDLWAVGDEVTVTIPTSRGSETLYLNVDGLNAQGVIIRGISQPLKEGDEIIREVDGQMRTFGKIVKINQDERTIEVEMYDQALPLGPLPTPTPQPQA